MECVKRLLVADASQEFRCHLVESFQNEPDMEVVGETGDGLQLLELTQKLLPDVIVMEMVLSGLDGLEVLERLRGLSLERHPKILVLSSYVREALPTWPPPTAPTTTWSSPAGSARSVPASAS